MTVQGVDDLGGWDATFAPEQDKILVQRNMGGPAIVRAVAREACLLKMGDQNLTFDARAAAYIICKRFGVDTQGMDFSDLREAFGEVETAQDAREVLSGIRAAAGEMIAPMAKELESSTKKREARA